VWQGGYVQGQYQIQKVDAASSDNRVQGISVNFPDVALSMDVNLASLDRDSNPGQTVYVGCRFRILTPRTLRGYVLQFTPALGRVALSRFDGTTTATLSSSQLAGAASSAVHHLQVTCSGATITASIDGSQVASAQDSTYTSGYPLFGVSVLSNSLPGTIDARFSNLVLTQPEGAAPRSFRESGF
jgi:hypothetical protein